MSTEKETKLDPKGREGRLVRDDKGEYETPDGVKYKFIETSKE